MLLYNEEKRFWTKKELLDFKFTLLWAKLVIVSLRPVSNGLIFGDDISVNIQLVTFSLLSNIRELKIGAKLENFDKHHCM